MNRLSGRNFRLVLSMAAMLGLAAASYAGDETASAGDNANQNEVQQLKQQVTDQQKQIEELRLILLGQKNQIDKMANAAAAPAEPPQATLPAIGRGTGEIASSTPQLPASTAVIPVAFTPAAPAAPAPQASAASQVPDSPLQLKIGGTTITPVGFLDFTNTWRSTADGDSLKTNFGKFPYNNSLPLARLSEDKLSVQNSRIGARFDAMWKDWHVLGYWESDFVGDFAGNNTQVTSNSVLLRLRLYWVNLRNQHFEVQAGQSWSLLTPNRNGLSALPGDLFYGQEFDVNYLNGLTWGRIPGIRFLYHTTGDKINLGVSLENADQYFGGSGGASSPLLPSAFQSNDYGNQVDASQTNDVNIPQLKPDIIAKLAIQPNSRVHFEIAGVESETKLFNAATNKTYVKAGAGGSVNANFAIFPRLRLITNNFWSDGEGRCLFGEVPNFIVRANGSPSTIHAGSTVDGIEAQIGSKLQVYAYYGGILSSKNTALDANGTTPIGWGYHGSSNAQNRTIQEATFGFIHTLWKDGKYGALQAMAQYAYFTRAPFYVAPNAPEGAHQNAIWFNLRYVLPGTAPTIKY